MPTDQIDPADLMHDITALEAYCAQARARHDEAFAEGHHEGYAARAFELEYALDCLATARDYAREGVAV